MAPKEQSHSLVGSRTEACKATAEAYCVFVLSAATHFDILTDRVHEVGSLASQYRYVIAKANTSSSGKLCG